MHHQQELLSDATLLAYLQGEVEVATVHQIEADVATRARVAELLRARQQTLSPLYPPATLDSLTLGAYHLDLLTPDAAAEVQSLVVQEPGRRAELQLLQHYLDELEAELPPHPAPQPAPKPSRLQQLGAQVEALIASLTPQPAPTFALLGDAEEQQVYIAGDVQIMVQVQDDESVSNYKAIYGLISGMADTALEVSLYPIAPSADVRTTPVTAFGNFVIEQVAAGEYALQIQTLTPDLPTTIRIPSLRI